jgi:hypothetical protein
MYLLYDIKILWSSRNEIKFSTNAWEEQSRPFSYPKYQKFRKIKVFKKNYY